MQPAKLWQKGGKEREEREGESITEENLHIVRGTDFRNGRLCMCSKKTNMHCIRVHHDKRNGFPSAERQLRIS